METRAAFGEALKRHRTKLGISQRELAERVGCSQVYVSKLEHGQCPTLVAAHRILAALGLSLTLGSGRRRLS